MANFKTTIITKKGHALMAKLSANVATMKFTKVCSSDFDYSNLNNSELEQVVTFKNLKQTVLPDLIKVVNTTTVKVNATITNTNLTEGYYLRTIGLFALDPDEGEILYSITPTSEADYMAADNGITKSGISLDLLTTISNSENVNLEIDPNATISADTFYNVVGDVAALENEGSNLVDGINKNTTQLNANTQNIANKIDKSKVVTNLAVTETGFLLDALTVVNKFKTIDGKLQEQTAINIYLDFNDMIEGWTVVNTNVNCANAPKTTQGILFQKTIGGSGIAILQLFYNTDGTKQMRTKWYGNWSTWN